MANIFPISKKDKERLMNNPAGLANEIMILERRKFLIKIFTEWINKMDEKELNILFESYRDLLKEKTK